jgi:transcriptional regulator with XRE-family HTH domain
MRLAQGGSSNLGVFMANDTKSSQPLVDERGAAFGRLASRILEVLNDAVDYRRERGDTLKDMAMRIGCHRSLLSRTLNGTSPNLTIRTISDILWAAHFEPQDFAADPIELLSPNGAHESYVGEEYFNDVSYLTTTISSKSNFEYYAQFNRSNTQSIEVVAG